MRDAPGFSFSGLKTAIATQIQRNPVVLTDANAQAELCHAAQLAIIDTLVHKLQSAVAATGVTQVAITGGVAANRALRARLTEVPKISISAPQLSHCTDNAAMIAYVGALRFAAGERLSLNADVFSRWPVEGMVLATPRSLEETR
jgi:N6-L-threonylcarbamoyladenine synthase